MVLRFCDSAVLWFCGSVVLWFCGYAVLWFCGSAVLRFCGSADLLTRIVQLLYVIYYIKGRGGCGLTYLPFLSLLIKFYMMKNTFFVGGSGGISF